MLNDWIYWLSSLKPDEIVIIIGGLVLVDGPRYGLSQILMCLFDFVRDLFRNPNPSDPYPYCPSVCVVLAGLNESATLGATLRSLWGTYPRMEVIVIDDGSTDGMPDVAREFARQHKEVRVLTRLQRGGKSSALNVALPLTRADVIVTVDTDSHLGDRAIWEIVQPLADPTVGAVSATVRARNAFVNLCSWCQAYEYLQTIFLGRMLAARLGILSIVSGAFGAFRREALERVGGWDVGPGEDGDLSLRIRKSGYRIAFAPYAQCLTNVPLKWTRLFKQRRRWDRAVITFECRKHLDMICPWNKAFRLRDVPLFFDRWFFNVICLYALWIYLAWLCFDQWHSLGKLFTTLYFGYLAVELAAVLSILYYSNMPRRDAAVCLALPLAPFYQLFIKAASLVAVTEELFWRQNYRDEFVPEHVREATWHW
jgi:cellulose synthase/poly-beta-1,6-N-acetylglucosamine synthase-like glycosyltransferase